MGKFSIEITSVPDRHKLVAEVWFKDDLVAEINQEESQLQIEIYHIDSGSNMFFLEEFLNILVEAKERLSSN